VAVCIRPPGADVQIIGKDRSVTGPGLRACSACAGDYEDPERTTAAKDDLSVDSDDEHGATAGDSAEFPDSKE
jgi:hypothetical protein